MRKAELRVALARSEEREEYLRGELQRWMEMSARERVHMDVRVDRLLSFITSPGLAALHARADQLEADTGRDYPPPSTALSPENEPTLGQANSVIEAELRARGVTPEEVEAALAEADGAGVP